MKIYDYNTIPMLKDEYVLLASQIKWNISLLSCHDIFRFDPLNVQCKIKKNNFELGKEKPNAYPEICQGGRGAIP